jgi:G:T/U-mismatch repair DNA glycosylase
MSNRVVGRPPVPQATVHSGGESARARRHLQRLGLATLRLSSTNPANASPSFERKLSAWRDAFAECGLAKPGA